MTPMAHTLRVPGPYVLGVLLPASWQGGPREVDTGTHLDGHGPLLPPACWIHGGLGSRMSVRTIRTRTSAATGNSAAISISTQNLRVTWSASTWC